MGVAFNLIVDDRNHLLIHAIGLRYSINDKLILLKWHHLGIKKHWWEMESMNFKETIIVKWVSLSAQLD